MSFFSHITWRCQSVQLTTACVFIFFHKLVPRRMYFFFPHTLRHVLFWTLPMAWAPGNVCHFPNLANSGVCLFYKMPLAGQNLARVIFYCVIFSVLFSAGSYVIFFSAGRRAFNVCVIVSQLPARVSVICFSPSNLAQQGVCHFFCDPLSALAASWVALIKKLWHLSNFHIPKFLFSERFLNN